MIDEKKIMFTHKGTKVEDLENEAQKVLSKSTYDYIAGGAGREWGVVNNHQAFDGYQIVPRVLQNVSFINTSLELLGRQVVSPIIIGPCAFHKLVCPRGELATAQACLETGTIMTLSTMSSYSIEEVAETSNSNKWFQLYVFKDRAVTKDLIQRAEKAGYSALVVTVDVPAMGIRLRDIKNNFSLPYTVEAANFKSTELSSISIKTDGSTIKNHTDKQFDAGLTWETLDWLRSITKLPLILKGILNSDDAVEALKHGVEGIVVSNHGGRQLDSVVAPIDALPIIANAINNRIPIFVDGGFSSGEDIFKAIALGATAVMIARPVMWALALGGDQEVTSLLRGLQEELVLTMRLTGCSSLQRIRELGMKLLTGQSMIHLKQLGLPILENKSRQLDTFTSNNSIRKPVWLS